MREEITHLLISPDATLREAVATIDRGARQIALVVNGDGLLVATVTDGDVRRGLLKGADLDTPVASVMHTNPVVTNASDGPEAARRLMRERNLHHMPIVDDSGLLVDLARIDEVAGPAPNATRVVLMAGGLGKRLRPLTESIPKPMLPVGGRPLLELIIRNLLGQGFSRFTISVNYRGDMLRDYFGDGTRLGAEIDYIDEDTPMGTAGALSLLPSRPQTPFIVMNGDILTSVPFESLLRFHEETGAAATMCARDYTVQVPYGVIRMDGSRLVDIEEKPMHSHFVNAGIYVLSPELLDDLERGIPLDMTSLFERLIARGDHAAVFPIREYWMDIGRVEDLERARADFEMGRAK
ncbi:nucleotidyltransferase family protein [Fodinicurvata sp. EGI_FJ10296]|uniref:nucleotidyltransferase family protein n=1 Tax=Fodinicurvata sp. EGI_FJ10296 TaxID=3231908 RepID=UPI003452EB1D